MKLFRRSTSLIGLDLGSRVVKAAQLQRGRTGWRVRAVATVPRISDQPLDQTAARLAGVLERQGFTGGGVVLAAPIRKLECETLELPPRSSGAPIEQIAAVEMAQTAKLEPGKFETGCWDVPAAARSNGTAVLALALRHEDADALVQPLENAGLEVEAIDVQARALHRACRPMLGDNASAILDLGWSAASLQVADRQTLLYQRILWDSGTEYIHKAIVAEHGLSHEAADLVLRCDQPGQNAVAIPAWLPAIVRRFADQLSDELDVSLSFARQRFPDLSGDQMLLTGGGAMLPGLARLLADRLGMKITAVRAGQIADFSVCTGAEGESPLLATALGLAMHGEAL